MKNVQRCTPWLSPDGKAIANFGMKANFFGLTSHRTDLQDLVGDGGTLWIVVSRRQTTGPRTYSLSFRLDRCKRHTFQNPGRFGPYAIIGDPGRSTLFASNDARLLLLSLRFDPILPIDHSIGVKRRNKETADRLKKIGFSIQTPRCLNAADIKLLQDFASDADRWSVFISYRSTKSDTGIATRLNAALRRRGVNVFRDKEALRPGQIWWPTLKRAIARSRHLVVIIGRTTHESVWVKREVRHAKQSGVNVIPVLAGGTLENWTDCGLDALHSLGSGLITRR